ncbi:hypothetical protein ACSBR1_019919 [Camellia fascicularis]
MGNCNSDESTSVVTTTAKLVFLDGALQEFSSPVKVSHVLQKNPACFVCDSDDMYFDDFISAMGGEEELRLGQLYFALPLNWLGQPLQAEDMAALAVKASVALGKSCGSGGGGGERSGFSTRKVDPFVFSDEKRAGLRRNVGGSGGGGLVEERRGRRGGGGSGGGRHKGLKFTAKLSVIEED